jgi:lipopolysaccharide transport system ATP-binding protein
MPSAIRVKSLGKCYQIGQYGQQQVGGYRTLRESLVGMPAAFMRRIRTRPSADRSEEFWALRGVDFEISPGEVVGIIGRNGAGKSTLLKILSRITRPTVGRVELHGRVGSLLEVGTGFHPELTGRENIYLNGSILGMSRREIARRFDEIVAFAEVDRFLDTPVKRYSSGMFVRLAFSVAAYLEPEILLVDEVLAVGDAEFQKKCIGRMREISHHGRTVLFVSHNMAAVLSLCRKAVLLSDGRVESEGPVAAIAERYMKRMTSLTGGDIDLRNHLARGTGCLPLITRIRFFNGKGELTDMVGCGEELTIALDFNPVVPIERPHFGIGFDDAMGQRIFSVGSYLTEAKLPPIRSPQTVYCNISSLALVPGTYSLNLSAGTVGQPLMDALHNAVAIEITEADFFGNGRVPKSNLGAVLVRSFWRVDNEQTQTTY